MNVFVMRRNEKVKGRSRIEEVMVWESLRVKMENNSFDLGIPMVSNSDRRRNWIVVWKGMESRKKDDERRIEVEKGSAKRDVFVK